MLLSHGKRENLMRLALAARAVRRRRSSLSPCFGDGLPLQHSCRSPGLASCVLASIFWPQGLASYSPPMPSRADRGSYCVYLSPEKPSALVTPCSPLELMIRVPSLSFGSCSAILVATPRCGRGLQLSFAASSRILLLLSVSRLSSRQRVYEVEAPPRITRPLRMRRGLNDVAVGCSSRRWTSICKNSRLRPSCQGSLPAHGTASGLLWAEPLSSWSTLALFWN
jgi:hypothetical protein